MAEMLHQLLSNNLNNEVGHAISMVEMLQRSYLVTT